MSWNLYRSSGEDQIDREDIEVLFQRGAEGLQRLEEGHIVLDADPEEEEQQAAAIEAAKILARVVGRPGDKVRVTFGGHANREHDPEASMQDEFLTVTVFAQYRF